MSMISPGERPLAGLSTDLYFPPLSELWNSLSAFPPGYLEIFRGRTLDLQEARKNLPKTIPLTYHGDCLWYTQPDYTENPAFRAEEKRAIRHMEALKSPWMIHECAQKSMEGFDFGLYAPPLLSPEGALVAREGAMFLAQTLGNRLLLVETPPFPPHPPGGMDLGSFFRELTANSPLAIGLDLGHCITFLAASGYSVNIGTVLEWLLDFPLDRVVEIHVGGMHFLPLEGRAWPIDDHASPLPYLLFQLLEQILSQLPLPALQGVALEVDNKDARLAAEEFFRFRTIINTHSQPGGQPLPSAKRNDCRFPITVRDIARSQYAHLARALSGGSDSPYSQFLYPKEIWEFGGHMEELFPETLSTLSQAGVDVQKSFVNFFNQEPHESFPGQDFLEIKIRRTGDWIDHLLDSDHNIPPSVRDIHHREAHLLLQAQHLYNGDPHGT